MYGKEGQKHEEKIGTDMIQTVRLETSQRQTLKRPQISGGKKRENLHIIIGRDKIKDFMQLRGSGK